MPPELPVLHLKKWTVRALPADRPRATRTARTVSDKQSNCPQTPCNQNQLPRRIKPRARKNKQRTGWTQGLADCLLLPGGLSARCRRSSLSLKTRSQPLISIHGSPKWLELLRKDLGEKWSVPRRCYTPKLEPSNELNRRKSNCNRAQPKS
jgi:hypothetical protein